MVQKEEEYLTRESNVRDSFIKQFNEQEKMLEDYMQSMADNINNTGKIHNSFRKEVVEEQEKTAEILVKLYKSYEKIEEERKKMEQLKKQIEKNVEDLSIESKKRPENEMEMYNRATQNLDTERQLLSSERQKLEQEFKKLSDLKEEINNLKIETQKKIEKRNIETISAGAELVLEWLNKLELGFYYQKFIDYGYDTLDICSLIEEPELIEMEITKIGHRKSLLNACSQLKERKSPLSISNDTDPQKNNPETSIEDKNIVQSNSTDNSSHPLLNSPKELSQKLEREKSLPRTTKLPDSGKPQGNVSTPNPTNKIPSADPTKTQSPAMKSPTTQPKSAVGLNPQLGFSQDLESSSSDTIYSETEEDIFADK